MHMYKAGMSALAMTGWREAAKFGGAASGWSCSTLIGGWDEQVHRSVVVAVCSLRWAGPHSSWQAGGRRQVTESNAVVWWTSAVSLLYMQTVRGHILGEGLTLGRGREELGPTKLGRPITRCFGCGRKIRSHLIAALPDRERVPAR
jgi:hypothetical protein